MKKILFLVNPVAGGGAGNKMALRLRSVLQGLLPDTLYDIRYTRPGGIGLEQETAIHYETIVAAGGDGTVSGIMQELGALHNRPKLGIIPIGTGNDLARALGLLRVFRAQGLKALLEICVSGKTRDVDVLSIDNKFYCTNYFGIGIDARIAHDFAVLRTRPFARGLSPAYFNKGVYGLLGIKNALYRLPGTVQLRYRNRDLQEKTFAVPRAGCGILITNIASYAAGALPCSKCSMDDGRFEVTLIANAAQWLLLHATRFLKKPIDVLMPGILQFQTDLLEIVCTGTMYCQADGEIYDRDSTAAAPVAVAVKTRLAVIVS